MSWIREHSDIAGNELAGVAKKVFYFGKQLTKEGYLATYNKRILYYELIRKGKCSLLSYEKRV